MKVLFIWLNFDCRSVGMNMGVSILSRELMEAGHEVAILHVSEIMGYPFEVERICLDAEEFSPDLLALSFGSNYFPHAMALARSLRKRLPDVWIACGGIHTTLNPEDVIREPAVDIVCMGEVDGGHLVRFIERLEQGRGHVEFGNYWVRSNGHVQRNSLTFLPDISRQTFLNFDLIDYRALTRIRKGFLEVISSRGCPYKCSYCQNHALYSTYRDGLGRFQYLRQREVGNLIGELQEAHRRFGEEIRCVVFADDTFIMNKAWIRAFSDAYPRHFQVPFSCCGLVKLVDMEVAEALAAAHCAIVRFGIETGDEGIRSRILNKPMKDADFETGIRILRHFDINIGGYAMIGIPGETASDILKTYEYAARLRLDVVRSSIFHPYPNTDGYRYCLDRGLIDQRAESTSYSFTSVLKWPAGMNLFIEKASTIYAFILNMYLPHGGSEKCRSLVEKVLAMDEPDWRMPDTGRWLAEEAERLSADFTARGDEHYFSPFADRPDAVFLRRDRPRKLANIDD